MTTIAELFVNLGIKGSEKTVGALGNVQKGLKDTANASFEAKAALVGAFYALERLMAASSHMGTELTNFNAITGVSAKTLQQYQYAARQVGVSNQEVEGSFKALQSAMTKTLMGEGAPKGLARLAQLTGDIEASDIKKFAEQPQLLIQRFQKYFQTETNLGLRREVANSFGLGDAMQAAFARQAFKPEVLNRAPAYNDKEIAQLDKANAGWANIGNKIEMAFGHLNAKYGTQLVKDIDLMVTKVTDLVDAFMEFDKVVNVFKIIDKIFEGWKVIFEGWTQLAKALELVKAIDTTSKLMAEGAKGGTESTEGTTTDDATFGVLGQMFKDLFGQMKAVASSEPAGTPGKPVVTAPTGAPNLKLVPSPVTAPGAIAPKVQQTAPSGTNTTNNYNTNQNLNFQHDGKDAAKTADSVKDAVNRAYRQSPAQSQGS